MAEVDDITKCTVCDGPMVNSESIALGVCLWCRPWLCSKCRAVLEMGKCPKCKPAIAKAEGQMEQET